MKEEAPSSESFETKRMLNNRSKELLTEQHGSYNTIQLKATGVITAVAIFIPLIFSLLPNIHFSITILASIGALAIMIWGLIEMLSVLKNNELKSGFHFKKIEELLYEGPYTILLHEISANITSFELNASVLDMQEKKYTKGLKIIIISIILVTVILSIDITLNKVIMPDNKEKETQPLKNEDDSTESSNQELPDYNDSDLQGFKKGNTIDDSTYFEK